MRGVRTPLLPLVPSGACAYLIKYAQVTPPDVVCYGLRMELHLDHLRRIIGNALTQGAERKSATVVEWNIAGRCESPVTVTMTAKPEGSPDVLVAPGRAHPLELGMEVPCRKCRRCLIYRSALWTGRAKAEIGMSVRTWFGTLTLNPGEQYRAVSEARLEAHAEHLDYDALSEEERFIRRVRVIAREITKWLKRVRKEARAPLRFMLVAERHKSGEPHWHVLVHEPTFRPVRYETLKKQWFLGHAQFKLVNDEQPASYVCKYLTKVNEGARVRASLHYGEGRSSTPAARREAMDHKTATFLGVERPARRVSQAKREGHPMAKHREAVFVPPSVNVTSEASHAE